MVRMILPGAFALYLLAFYAAVPLSAGRQTPADAARTVWDGVFTTEQADRGRTLYGANCAECHGGNLQGGEGKPLSGDQFWNDWRETTVGELFDYVSKNMPFSDDGSRAGTLGASTYVDIVAHILRSNGLPPGARELTAASSPGVRIIRKEGAGELPSSTLAHVVGCLAPRAADGSWRLIKATRPERVAQGAASRDAEVPLGDREYALKFVLRPLTAMVGHRLSVTGLLLGEGGVDGLNVSTIADAGATCN